jgi:glycosyltransferase involved in cell wall biosynthesis
MKTLSIVIPVFNEARTIAQVLERVRKASSAGLEKELVVVDDGSTDGTREYLAGLREPDTRCVFHERNRG